MSYIPSEIADQIRTAAQVEDIIADDVTLKTKGSSQGNATCPTLPELLRWRHRELPFGPAGTTVAKFSYEGPYVNTCVYLGVQWDRPGLGIRL